MPKHRDTSFILNEEGKKEILDIRRQSNISLENIYIGSWVSESTIKRFLRGFAVSCTSANSIFEFLKMENWQKYNSLHISSFPTKIQTNVTERMIDDSSCTLLDVEPLYSTSSKSSIDLIDLNDDTLTQQRLNTNTQYVVAVALTISEEAKTKADAILELLKNIAISSNVVFIKE
jgi:hypothetical protein